MPEHAYNGDVRIAYEDLGGHGGDPLLLVMGLGASRFWWPDGLVAELVGQGFHVVAYDQRDAGESTRFPDRAGAPPFAALVRRRTPAYTAEALCDDAIAVLDAVGWDAAHLFGHSMGGLLAQRTAIRHPDRVLTMTSSGAVPSDAAGLAVLRYLRLGTVARFARMRSPEGPDAAAAFATAVGDALVAPGRRFEVAEARVIMAKEAAAGVASFHDPQAQSRQIGAKWHGGRLAEVAVPSLVLHGADDPLVRVSAAHAIANAVPGAGLTVIPGAGHLLHREVWPQYAARLRTFVDRSGTSRTARAG